MNILPAALILAVGCSPFAPDTQQITAYGGGRLDVTVTGDLPMHFTAPGVTRDQLDALRSGYPDVPWGEPWVVLRTYPDQGHSVSFVAAEFGPSAVGSAGVGPWGPASVNWQAGQLGLGVTVPSNPVPSLVGVPYLRANVDLPVPTGPSHHVSAPVEWFVFDGAGTRVVGRGRVEVRLDLDPGVNRTWDATISRCSFC